MRILAIGDLHGDLNKAKELAELAKEKSVDLILLNGDFTIGDRHTPGLLKVFKDTGKPIAMLPGNHESLATFESLLEHYEIKNLHGYSLKLGDVGLFGCGSADLGLFQLSEKEIYYLLKKSHENIKTCKKKIMVTHVRPKGIKFDNLFSGSSAVAKAIKAFKPDIALCAHIHEAEGLEDFIGHTKVITVGKNGKILEI
ncbi:MAG: metallophosphoesterase [Candidatus Nanoarchaeia archaeon]